MLERFHHLDKYSGSSLLHIYLKEVNRVLVRILAGSPIERSQKTYIKFYGSKTGLLQDMPKIIPREIAEHFIFTNKIQSFSYRVIIVVFTIINIYRVLNTNPKISFSTVTDSFCGVTKTIDKYFIDKGLRSLKLNKLSVKKATFINSRSAGPNSKIAVFGIVEDALSLLHNLPNLNRITHFMCVMGDVK